MRYVLDTNVVLYLLGGRLSEHLPLGEHFVSIITEMELLSYPNLGNREDTAIRNCLSDLTIIGITEDIKDHAIALRRLHTMKLPDAVIAATAISLSAELLSCDERLVRLPDFLSRKLQLK